MFAPSHQLDKSAGAQTAYRQNAEGPQTTAHLFLSSECSIKLELMKKTIFLHVIVHRVLTMLCYSQ